MRVLIFTWAVFGVVALLLQAVIRLVPPAIEPWQSNGMSIELQCVYLIVVIVHAYAEGYRAFQKKFSPRVIRRAYELSQYPKPLHVILAIPYCLNLFHAENQWVRWLFFLLLCILIAVVKMMPQPWRGMIDAGVVTGLGWGILSLLFLYVKSLLSFDFKRKAAPR